MQLIHVLGLMLDTGPKSCLLQALHSAASDLDLHCLLRPTSRYSCYKLIGYTLTDIKAPD